MLAMFIIETHNRLYHRGWGNGYVLVQKGHPLHGLHYDEIHEQYPELDVHGGLTFSEFGSKVKDFDWDIPFTIDDDDYVIGFDTAHYGDDINKWSKDAVMHEAKKLLKQVEQIGATNA